MLNGYDFSSCDIPVRLNPFFFFVNVWCGCEGSLKISCCEKRQCSEEEEATQSKCNSDRIRREFLLHTEVLMREEKKEEDLWQNEILSSPEINFRKTKSRWGFSVCWVSSGLFFLFATWLKPVAQTGRRRVSDCMALLVQLAWDVRGNQSKQSNTWPPRPQWGDGESMGWGVGGTLIQTGGRRSEARGGGDKVVQKKKTTLAEHS